jgi:uncharacterized sulfatase
VVRSFQDAVWGGAPDDPNHNTFSVKPWPGAPRTYGIGVAPFSYWQRSLDMYTLVQQMVDQAIGDVVAAIPKPVLANTVIVFAADHGDYAGAHGFLSGKIGTAYEEAIHIPLIVTDPTHRFARNVQRPRRQLASSVDLMPMLVTLGNRGSISWRRGRLADIYGERLNLVQLVRDPDAAGRGHILFATDEIMPRVFNYLHAPTHVLAVRTRKEKLVTYSHWFPGTTRPRPARCSLSSTTTPQRKGGPRPGAIRTIPGPRRWHASCSPSTCRNSSRPRCRPRSKGRWPRPARATSHMRQSSTR